MKDTPVKKVTLILVIAILLWIGAGMVRSVSEERRGRRTEVMQELSSSLTPDQRLETAYIEVPTQETYREESKLHTDSGETRQVYPLKAEFKGAAQVETRSRGIFNAQAYSLKWSGTETFDFPLETELLPEPVHSGGHVASRMPRLVLPIGSKKGLKQFPVVKIAGISKPLKPESCNAGICYQLNIPYADLSKAIGALEISFELTGMDEIQFRSNAQESSFQLSSNWASPSFRGVNLPTSREISAQGFTAEWNLINTSYAVKDPDFSVRFMEPVDVYTLTDRATKYAVLFILTVFGSFFLVEVAAKLRIHPLQYGLVGAALVIFYLLVLSLAEHMPFGIAYLISSSASVSLIWFYLSATLRNRLRSALMGSSLSSLYGMLYVILSAEDYALLFGSALTFGLLAAIMITTRKLDWYSFEFPATVES